MSRDRSVQRGAIAMDQVQRMVGDGEHDTVVDGLGKRRHQVRIVGIGAVDFEEIFLMLIFEGEREDDVAGPGAARYTQRLVRSLTGDIAPEGPRYSFEVVGIVRRPLDLGGRGAKGGVIVPTQEFTREALDEVGSFSGDVLRVRTRNGAADLPEVVRAARRIFGANDSFNVTGLGIEGQGARNAIDVATTALWVLASIAALAGLVAIGLALARQMAHASAEQEALPLIVVIRDSRFGIEIRDS